jgi:hypothetical protein
MQIDTWSSSITAFTRKEVVEAVKSFNFKKGMGPDCFFWGVLHRNEHITDKMITKITEALSLPLFSLIYEKGDFYYCRKSIQRDQSNLLTSYR